MASGARLQDSLLPPEVYRFYVKRDLDIEYSGKVRRLWIAVLQRALQDYAAMKQRGGTDDELEGWFHSPDEMSVGSFRFICSLLELDADLLLNRLDHLVETGVQHLRNLGSDVY